MKLLYTSGRVIAETSFAYVPASSPRSLGARPQWKLCLLQQGAPISSSWHTRSQELSIGTEPRTPEEPDSLLSKRRLKKRAFISSVRHIDVGSGSKKKNEQTITNEGAGIYSDEPLGKKSRPLKISRCFSLRVRKLRSTQEDEAGQPEDEPPLDASAPWAMRIGPIFDPAIKSLHEHGQVRRLLTRGERGGLNKVANSLGEVLGFAQAIKKNPWTPEELGVEQRVLDELMEEEDSESKDETNFKTSDSMFPTTTGRRLSNYSILAGYIDLKVREPVLIPEQYDKLLLELFSDEALWWLESNGGVTVEEIVAWAWILEAESNYAAVSRLLVWTNRPMPQHRVPRIVFYMLLKRKITEPAVIQLLAAHFAHRLANTIDHDWEAVYKGFSEANTTQRHFKVAHHEQAQMANYVQVDTWRTAVYMLILINFAMYSVPILLPNLARMMCKQVDLPRTRSNVREDGVSFQDSVSLTMIFNRAIVIMARKSAEPYLNVPYQERGQFIILRHMNTFQPPLTIGLRAYRAIINVQLRHRKTIKERLWTELKSRAWPPYREDKLGIDALKKDEDYGTSRAQHAIVNLKEAGFAPTVWEDSASVLSGWDLNRSPTIQSRRLFLDRAQIKDKKEVKIPRESIWQTRILATRTIEEAWAVFLNYLEEDLPRTSDVFLSMFEKISFERDRLKHVAAMQDRAASTALAGDMPETMPSSRNPREQVYTPSPPPSFAEFYQRYRTYFPVLDVEALCFLLPRAESLAQGYHFVEKSHLVKTQQDILLRNSVLDDDEVPMESRIVVAYIRMLSNFASSPLPNHKKVSALSHAIHLVVSRNPRARGPWRALLQAIRKEISDRGSPSFWLEHWRIVLGIVQRMEKARVFQDSEIFYVVCSIFVCLVRYSSKTSADGKYYSITPSFESASGIRGRTGKLVKGMFKRMVTVDLRTVFCHTEKELPYLPLSRPDMAGLNDSAEFRIANLLPHLLYIPSPPSLHLFVRLLGVVEDRKAVFDLLRWMAIYHRELEAKATEMARGARQFRTVLVAVRIVMESRSVPFISLMTLENLTGQDLEFALEAKQIVESVKEWGSWPTDEEVKDYMQDGTEILNKDEEEYTVR